MTPDETPVPTLEPLSAPTRALVTGATGLLGSHLVEQLVNKGACVRALVRPASQTAFLETLGVEILKGNLNDPASCTRAVEGVDTVYHSASKVGDWGTWQEFQRDSIQATEILGAAAAKAGVDRFLHISSTSAYGHPGEGQPPVDENAELGQNLWKPWDHYTRSKVEQERALWRLAERSGLRLTVIRPSWLYGERDRTTTARLVNKIRRGGIPLIGRGDNPLSAVYAGEVARAALMAADNPRALGQAYNITDLGPISQRDFFGCWAKACQTRPKNQSWPYPAVFAVALLLEAGARSVRSSRPPMITRYATWLMARDLSYSTAKARAELGWNPLETYAQTIERTVAWYLDQEHSKSPSGIHQAATDQ